MPKPRWKHQEEAYQFLIGKDAGGLFLGMGAGKSRVAIDLLTDWNIRLAWIICPARVISVWPGQFAEHAPGMFRVIPLDTGSTAKNAKLIQRAMSSMTQSPTVFVINYENTWRSEIKNCLLYTSPSPRD